MWQEREDMPRFLPSRLYRITPRMMIFAQDWACPATFPVSFNDPLRTSIGDHNSPAARVFGILKRQVESRENLETAFPPYRLASGGWILSGESVPTKQQLPVATGNSERILACRPCCRSSHSAPGFPGSLQGDQTGWVRS